MADGEYPDGFQMFDRRDGEMRELALGQKTTENAGQLYTRAILSSLVLVN